MGAVQRLATVVIIGLVALATVLVLYLADESNRIDATQAMQREEAIERAQANYVSLCLQCHGPAGEGYEEKGTGRIGMPLGGSNTSVNQHAVNAKGTPIAGGMDARAEYLSGVLHNGRGAMPAWGEENGGPLNDAQIEELVVFIQHADWNEVYNHVIEVSGGYPTPVPAATKAPEPTVAPGGGGVATTFEIDMVDIAFQPTELVIPADTEVTIKLVNKGAAQHNFYVDALGIQSDTLNGGETLEIKIKAAAGEYEYHCAIPGHKEAGMVGKLKVVPASELGGGAEAGSGTPTADSGAGAAALPTTVELSAVDIAWEPTELTIPADTEVTIKITNNGAAQHNFYIDALGIKSDTINSGETVEIKVTAAAGEYDFYCAIPGHKEAGMVGKLKVVAAGAASGDAGAAPADSGAASAAATSVDVSLIDIAFEPTTLEIAANTDVTINLTNNGAAQHNFTIDGTDFASANLNSGESEALVVNLPPGEYTYVCTIPGHKEAGMVGKLVVK